MSDKQTAADRQHIRLAQLEVLSYELQERLDNAERKLRQLGYRRCDMIACNCKGYHFNGND